MRLKEAEKISVGDKVVIKDYPGAQEVLVIQEIHPGELLGFWLANGDLVNHKRIEKVIPQFYPGHNADRHLCKICRFRCSSANAKSKRNGCEYKLHNNHTRGCSVEDCNVFEKGNPKKGPRPISLI